MKHYKMLHMDDTLALSRVFIKCTTKSHHSKHKITDFARESGNRLAVDKESKAKHAIQQTTAMLSMLQSIAKPRCKQSSVSI